VKGEIVQSGYKLYGLHGYTHEADTEVFIKRKSSIVQVTDERIFKGHDEFKKNIKV